MAISDRVQGNRAARLLATVLYFKSEAKALGVGVLGHLIKPRVDLTRLSPHLRQDAGIDEQSVIEETTKNATLIR